MPFDEFLRDIILLDFYLSLGTKTVYKLFAVSAGQPKNLLIRRLSPLILFHQRRRDDEAGLLIFLETGKLIQYSDSRAA